MFERQTGNYMLWWYDDDDDDDDGNDQLSPDLMHYIFWTLTQMDV